MGRAGDQEGEAQGGRDDRAEGDAEVALPTLANGHNFRRVAGSSVRISAVPER